MTDAGRRWCRFRRWYLTAPGRWARTSFRRALLVLALVVALILSDAATAWGLVAYLLSIVAVYAAVVVLVGAWDYQLHEKRTTPPEPPEPVYTAILAAPYNPGDLAPHVLAGWDQIAGTVAAQGRALGIDVDDPHTLTVLAAALVMAEAYAEHHPVTLEAAVRLHETAWKVRLRDVVRWDETPSTGTP